MGKMRRFKVGIQVARMYKSSTPRELFSLWMRMRVKKGRTSFGSAGIKLILHNGKLVVRGVTRLSGREYKKTAASLRRFFVAF